MNGKREPENRCRAYAIGPITAAKEERNRIEPKDHLRREGILAHHPWIYFARAWGLEQNVNDVVERRLDAPG